MGTAPLMQLQALASGSLQSHQRPAAPPMLPYQACLSLLDPVPSGAKLDETSKRCRVLPSLDSSRGPKGFCRASAAN